MIRGISGIRLIHCFLLAAVFSGTLLYGQNERGTELVSNTVIVLCTRGNDVVSVGQGLLLSGGGHVLTSTLILLGHKSATDSVRSR